MHAPRRGSPWESGLLLNSADPHGIQAHVTSGDLEYVHEPPIGAAFMIVCLRVLVARIWGVMTCWEGGLPSGDEPARSEQCPLPPTLGSVPKAAASGWHHRDRDGDASVDCSHAVYGLGWYPYGLPPAEVTGEAAHQLQRRADPAETRAPEEQLRTVVARLSGGHEFSASAGADPEPLGRVLVFRPWPARSLHVVGQSPLAEEFRRLIAAGAVPGWNLHRVPQGRTRPALRSP